MPYTPPSDRRSRWSPAVVIGLVLGLVIAVGVSILAWDSLRASSNRSDRERLPQLQKERSVLSDRGYIETPDGLRDRPGAEAARAREEGMRMEAEIRDILRRNPDLR